MTVLSYQTIKGLCVGDGFAPNYWDEETGIQNGLVYPFYERTVVRGKSFGVSHCGYDIRIKLESPKIILEPHGFCLAVSLERLKIPNDLVACVHDKSSWARLGLALQNTILEPGWEGYITLELSSHRDRIVIYDGDPIAQLIFHKLDKPTEKPYTGKYQNQPNIPIDAINEAGQ